jgi:ABC-type enterochelin transport system substrate-binding protein
LPAELNSYLQSLWKRRSRAIGFLLEPDFQRLAQPRLTVIIMDGLDGYHYTTTTARGR